MASTEVFCHLLYYYDSCDSWCLPYLSAIVSCVALRSSTADARGFRRFNPKVVISEVLCQLKSRLGVRDEYLLHPAPSTLRKPEGSILPYHVDPVQAAMSRRSGSGYPKLRGCQQGMGSLVINTESSMDIC